MRKTNFLTFNFNNNTESGKQIRTYETKWRNLLRRADGNFDNNGNIWQTDGPFVVEFYQMNSLVEYSCPQKMFDFGVRGNLIFYLVRNEPDLEFKDWDYTKDCEWYLNKRRFQNIF